MSSKLRLYFPRVTVHLGIVALFAVGMQAIAIVLPASGDAIPKRLLFQISYLFLLFFVAANWRRPGILIIGIGLFLNFLAIVANGGLMPVTAKAYAEIGQTHEIEGLKDGDAIPYQKEVLKSRENTNLYFLSDRLVWDNPFHLRVFSIGDVVIGAGLAVTLADLFVPRLKRVRLDNATPET